MLDQLTEKQKEVLKREIEERAERFTNDNFSELLGEPPYTKVMYAWMDHVHELQQEIDTLNAELSGLKKKKTNAPV